MAGPCHVATTGHPDPATILSTTDLRSTAASAGVSSPGTSRSAGIGTGATAAASVAPVPDPQGDAVEREALHLRALRSFPPRDRAAPAAAITTATSTG
jgi:hypothetical protein